ncbi:MAG: hypothetical protein IKJ69_04025 [Clostridia bacterium]|nr:hypothetical protein [Clostridia bacterium]
MNLKSFSALILSLVLVFSLTACGKDKAPEAPDNSTTASTAADTSEEFTSTVPDDTRDTTATSADTSETSSTEQTADTDESSTVAANVTTQSSDNPAEWSTQQIIDAYKKAANKTHSGVKSQHSIKIEKIKVNGDDLPDVVVSIMKKLLKNNSSDKDGITGGYNHLVVSDVASAEAYKNGSALVIEMTMKNQTAGPNEDANSGSVGHAITTVGDISAVTKQLADLNLPLDLNEKETKIYYTNPTVQVLIGPDGKIVNGTWQYTVDIRLNNYKAFGQDVESTSVVMLNTLTVNGGFKKM